MKEEIEHVTQEGVNDHAVAAAGRRWCSVGRATPRRCASRRWIGPPARWCSKPGTERDIECDLIVSAIGQGADFTGFEFANNGKGAAAADGFFRSPARPGVFVGGDAIKPHLLTTAIGHGWKAAVSIDRYVTRRRVAQPAQGERAPFQPAGEVEGSWGRPPRNTITFKAEAPIAPPTRCTISKIARDSQIIPADELFLAHFDYTPRESPHRGKYRRQQRPGQFRAAPSDVDRSRGAGRSGSLHELRHVLRMQ